MKLLRIFLAVLTVAALMLWAALASAADFVIGPQSLQGPAPIIYDKPEGIVFDAVVMDGATQADVTAMAAYEVTLKPGTRIEAGARFFISMKDNDGLPNRCEMTYFGDLDENPGDDYDGDQLTNLQECQIGTDPTENNLDNDGDGLPDWWEIQFFGLSLDQGRNDDADADGVSNFIEYKLGTDPNTVNSKGPGLHYEYDELGRVNKIQRVPSK